ncbi:hypothetical protein HYE68_000073 [Fusarium pseudograminearum]|nr:hypothetical protein HYE68_000073 [Fusarium pseudograminearum]
MASRQLTPALMVGSFLLGLSFALAHHFYYLYLDEIIVQSQSQQQWHLRAGTGLAFLVRAFLSAAVGIAYTQILWRTLRSKSITIGGVNSLFGVMNNPWAFIGWELWTAAPLLAVVAIIAWALPLVAIITPATLTVTVSSQPNITSLHAPISTPDYANVDTFGSWTVASLGSILTIPPPFPNSSYALDFHGPTLSCHNTKNQTFSRQVGEILENNKNQDADTTIVFVGFVPNFGRGNGSSSDANEYALTGLKYALNESVATTYRLDYTETGPAKFYVALRDETNSNPNVYKTMKTIECELYNSSFATNFSFNNGQQNISYTSKKLNPVAFPSDFRSIAMFGSDHWTTKGAYLSLMNAMGQLVLGTIINFGSSNTTNAVQTLIRSSSLMDTNEMYGFKKGRPESMKRNTSMSDALEDLFANLTISLFSHPRFLQNSSAVSHVPVTYSSAQNEFSYEPRNLLVAYGVGLFLAWAIVIVGLLCIKSASASYGSSFSTILRTTRNPDIDKIVPVAETTGAEPLPKHLSNVRLVLRRQEGRPESGDEEKATFFTVDSKSHEMEREPTNDPAESLLQRDKPMLHTSTSVESSITYDESLRERDGDLSLGIFNYRQDRR